MKKSKGITPDVIMEAMADRRIDPDDYIPFKLSRRFEEIARGLHAAHNKPKDESGGMLVEMLGERIDKYEKVKAKTGSDAEAKLAVLADQMGIDISKATEEQKQAVKDFMGQSKWRNPFRRKRK